MKTIKQYINKLNELDTEHAPSVTNIFSVSNVFRDDIVTNINDRDAMMTNAPDNKGGLFKVPKAIGV